MKPNDAQLMGTIAWFVITMALFFTKWWLGLGWIAFSILSSLLLIKYYAQPLEVLNNHDTKQEDDKSRR